jgi:transcriptional regulator with XRE-family HTH domain
MDAGTNRPPDEDPPMPSRKLTAADARAIAQRIAAGERHTSIAADSGVSVETVGAIKSGKRWADAIDADLRERMRAAAPVSALDEAAARCVMAALEAARPGADIAEEFGISASMVSAIRHGRAWAALDPQLPARLAEKSPQGKALTAARVAELKRRLADGASQRTVAAEFGVSASTVRSIAQGRTWTGVAAADV